MGKHGVRFGHVALRTADAERIVHWYDEAFGAERVLRTAPGRAPGADVSGIPQSQYLEIFTNGKPRADQPADAIGYQHFCLIVDDIDARLEHLAAMNV
jgi:lactoylglutathione lyase